MNHDRNERGSALMIAMLVLLVMALLTATMTVWSLNLLRDSHTRTDMTRGMYGLESAAHHALWLLFFDASSFPGKVELDRVDYSTDERFVADGRPHYFRVAGMPWTFELRLFDLYGGIQMENDGAAAAEKLIENQPETTIAQQERAQVLLNRLLDYVDADDVARDGSLEREIFTELGKPLLPRNSYAPHPEEYAAIPGLLELFPPDEYGRMAWFMPTGFPAAKPNIFAVPRELVYRAAQAGKQQKEYIDEAFKNIVKYSYTLEFSMSLVDSAMWQTLSKYFSIEESGYYRLMIRPMAESSLRGRAVEALIRVERGGVPDGDGRITLISFRYL
ncbi:MAG: hypothetical protein PHI85_01315 [Victivallaceae bacterium]|nr:hypothetical protein [Victivallaceae bacterium]